MRVCLDDDDDDDEDVDEDEDEGHQHGGTRCTGHHHGKPSGGGVSPSLSRSRLTDF